VVVKVARVNKAINAAVEKRLRLMSFPLAMIPVSIIPRLL
jgi:hypothetical protein